MHLASKLLLTPQNARQLVEGQRVFLRVDFNVPLDTSSSGTTTITSDLRIKAAIGTIELLLQSGAKRVVLASHLGRPDGQPCAKMSLRPVGEYLAKMLGKEVIFATDCVGEEAQKTVNSAADGSIVLLENLRFHIEEEGKGKDAQGKSVKATDKQIAEFRAQLSSLCDVYINDAFGTAHRAHSSMVGFEQTAVRAAGLLMAREISNFSQVLEKPQRPVLTILGGAKVVDKTKLIMNLLDKTDKMIICGGMAFTFLKELRGMAIGKSLYDESSVSIIPEIMKKAKEKNVEIVFPCDFVTAPAFDSTDTAYADGDIPADMMGLDMGKKSAALFDKHVSESKTILWNGPPGVFEKPQFEAGSIALLESVVKSKAVKIAGGGDTTSLVLKHNKEDKFDLVSTGGGASLELLEGKDLPGIVALSDLK